MKSRMALKSLLFTGSLLLSLCFLEAKDTGEKAGSNAKGGVTANIPVTGPDQETVLWAQKWKQELWSVKKHSSTFNKLHLNPESRNSPENTVAVSTPAPEFSKIDSFIAGNLAALGSILTQVGGKGYGDIDYWTRTCSLNAGVGVAALTELRTMARLAEGSNPMLKMALNNTIRTLETVVNENNGYGDIDYWTSKSSTIVRGLNQVGQNLLEISRSIP